MIEPTYIDLCNRITELVQELAEARRALSDSQSDAARWRKFCGLMAYGDFTIYDHSGPGEDGVPMDYIHQLTALVDAGSPLHVTAGLEDDRRCAGAPK